MLRAQLRARTVETLAVALTALVLFGTEVAANHLPPVAVLNFYPERAPLSSSNHGRMITGEEVTFDGRSSFTKSSGTVITTYRWFVNGSQVQSGTPPVFTYTAGAAGTNVTIGLEVRDSHGTWSTRRNVVMEVAPIPRRYYYITDHLGSVRAVTNELGELVAYSDYYPFGLEMPKRSLAGDDATKEGFTGHELDAETGLNYAGARYYDPEIARWLAVDPLWMKYPSLSPYNYVANNPLVFVDPDGREIRICNGDAEREGVECLVYEVGMEYKGGNTFIADVVTVLNDLANDIDEMGLVISLLAYTEDVHMIRPTRGINITRGRKGSRGSTIFLNTLQNPVDEAGVETNPWVALAHELGHSLDNQLNQRDVRKINGVSNNETRAVQLENIVRAQFNFPDRESYGTTRWGRVLWIAPEAASAQRAALERTFRIIRLLDIGGRGATVPTQ